MDSLSYKTVSINKKNADKQWVVVDAADQILGRFSSKVAKLLRGKYKPSFTPHADCGDNVIVLNADKIKLTGDKWNKKTYIRHTGYPGGQRSLTAGESTKKIQLDWLKSLLKVCSQKQTWSGIVPKSLCCCWV